MPCDASVVSYGICALLLFIPDLVDVENADVATLGVSFLASFMASRCMSFTRIRILCRRRNDRRRTALRQFASVVSYDS
jgi:hypothetical protein